MSLYKRGRLYWCKWTISGQTVRESTGATTRKEAQEYHDWRRAEIWRQARLGEQKRFTWDEAALAWATEHAQYKKSYTTDRFRLIWLTKRLTERHLDAITSDALLELRTEIIEDEMTPATANRHLAVASAVLHYAHAKGWIAGVPKIPYLREPKERVRWLTKEEARSLISQLPDHLADMAEFALATGLRRANVTGLTWDCIDLKRKVGWIWPDDAKSGKPIAVPLNGSAMGVLKRRAGGNARYVFTWRGNPVFHTTTKAWYAACKRAGIEGNFTWHDLRHTWASWHVMAGTPLEVLQKLGGWADMKMVLRYAHLAPGFVAAYAENVSLASAEGTILGTDESDHSEKALQVPENLGWTMGLEPTTTGITRKVIAKKRA